MTYVERRGFIVGTLSLLAAPLAVEAQAPQQVFRIGFLTLSRRPPDAATFTPALRRELLALGYVEGQHYVLEYRFADGVSRLPALATELVALPVDLIVADSTPAALATKAASRTVPIVFGVADDPVRRGLVNSFARPGGNVTGFTDGVYDAKRLQVLKEAVPRMSRIAYLCFCPSLGRQQDQSDITSAEARKVGVLVDYLHVGNPTALDRALASANKGGLVVADLSWMGTVHYKQIADFTTTHRLPATGPVKRFAEFGGLLHYGPKSGEGVARRATLIDRLSYIAGLGFGIASIVKFKLHKDNPTQFGLAVEVTFPSPLTKLVVRDGELVTLAIDSILNNSLEFRTRHVAGGL